MAPCQVSPDWRVWSCEGRGGEDIGGALYGAGLFVREAGIVVRDCGFGSGLTGSTVPTKHGGGIFIGDNLQGVQLENCEFVGNRASDSGAGLHLLNATVSLHSCSFEGSSVFMKGAHFSAVQSEVSLDQCALEVHWFPIQRRGTRSLRGLHGAGQSLPIGRYEWNS